MIYFYVHYFAPLDTVHMPGCQTRGTGLKSIPLSEVEINQWKSELEADGSTQILPGNEPGSFRLQLTCGRCKQVPGSSSFHIVRQLAPNDKVYLTLSWVIQMEDQRSSIANLCVSPRSR